MYFLRPLFLGKVRSVLVVKDHFWLILFNPFFDMLRSSSAVFPNTILLYFWPFCLSFSLSIVSEAYVIGSGIIYFPADTSLYSF